MREQGVPCSTEGAALTESLAPPPGIRRPPGHRSRGCCSAPNIRDRAESPFLRNPVGGEGDLPHLPQRGRWLALNVDRLSFRAAEAGQGDVLIVYACWLVGVLLLHKESL